MTSILLVEDNKFFRLGLKEMLRDQFPSIKINEAVTGTEALGKVQEHKPQLIFMDIHLPGENGLKLTRKIKEKYSYIIVIILTDYDIEEYREAASACGADHYLVKGTTSPAEIIALVKALDTAAKSSAGGE